MDWLTRGWDQAQWTAFGAGLAAAVALVVLGFSGLAELGGVLVSAGMRWAMWQIPPPGRSRATGAPSDATSRLAQVAVAVLLVTLAVEIGAAPFR